jgi:DNA-binding response OmpR family regulator
MSAAEITPDSARRILIVEDEDHICELLSEAIEEAGFQPQCARNDKAAQAALRTPAAFAALIVDINLGEGTTGYDVARFARQSRPALPVLYVSGQSTPDSFRAFGVKGSRFIQKPFLPGQVIEEVRSFVERED